MPIYESVPNSAPNLYTPTEVLERAKIRFGQIEESRSADCYMFRCPNQECDGKKSLSVNPLKGVFYCYRCQFGGKLCDVKGTEEARPDNFDIEQHALVTRFILARCTLAERHRKYLVGRGITDPSRYRIVTASYDLSLALRKVFDVGLLEDNGFIRRSRFNSNEFNVSMAIEPGRILIPCWEENEIVSVHSRVDPFTIEDFVPYCSLRGFPAGSRMWTRSGPSRDGIVTEGCLKAIAAHQFGWSVTAFYGLGNVTDQNLESVAKFAERFERTFLIFDRDHGPLSVLMSNRLKRVVAAVPTIIPIFLPRASDSEKEDLDSFLLRHGPEALKEVLNDQSNDRNDIPSGQETGWESRPR